MKTLIKKIIPVFLVVSVLVLSCPNRAYAAYTYYAVPNASSITSSMSTLAIVYPYYGVLTLFVPYSITVTAPTEDYYFKLTCVETGTAKYYGYYAVPGLTRTAVENIPIAIPAETGATIPAGAMVGVQFTNLVIGNHYNVEIVKSNDGGLSFTPFAAPLAQDIEISLATPGAFAVGVETESEAYWQPAVDMINLYGESNEAKTYVFDKGTSLPIQVMDALKNNPNVTLVFKYTYEDKDYEISILGADAIVDPDIPWYGPLWLDAHYGNGKTASAGGTYTVVSGDTLNKLAKKYNTSVDALLALNPEITNKDKIYVGQTINY